MAATIKDTEHDKTRKSIPKPILVNKLEGCSDVVNMAVTIPHEDAIISVSEDKYALIFSSLLTSLRLFPSRNIVVYNFSGMFCHVK